MREHGFLRAATPLTGCVLTADASCTVLLARGARLLRGGLDTGDLPKGIVLNPLAVGP